MEPISERRLSLAGVAGLSTALALFGLRGRQVSLVAKGALLGCGATGVDEPRAPDQQTGKNGKKA